MLEYSQMPRSHFISATTFTMSALFDFASLVTVLLLLICTCTYLRELRPVIFDGGKVSSNKWTSHEFLPCFAMLTPVSPCQVLEPGQRILPREGMSSFFWRMSRIGERLSPYIGAGCAIMVIHVLFIK